MRLGKVGAPLLDSDVEKDGAIHPDLTHVGFGIMLFEDCPASALFAGDFIRAVGRVELDSKQEPVICPACKRHPLKQIESKWEGINSRYWDSDMILHVDRLNSALKQHERFTVIVGRPDTFARVAKD